MKKYFSVLAAVALLISCDDSDLDKLLVLDEANTALLTQTVKADATKAESIAFTAAQAWTAASNAGWLTIDPTQGEAGEATIHLELEANTAKEARTAKFSISCGAQKLEGSVTQEAPKQDDDNPAKSMRYVKTLTVSCVQNVLNSPYIGNRTLDFEYDNLNRVVKYTNTSLDRQNDYTIEEIDYTTKEGSIFVTSWYSPTKKGQPMELTLGSDGLVSIINLSSSYKYPIERVNSYVTSMGLPPNEGMTLEHGDDWVLVKYKKSGLNDLEFIYDKKIPAIDFINIDLNWVLLSGVSGFVSGPASVALWGAFGHAGSLLLEQYPWNLNVEIPVYDVPDKTPGRHPYESRYNNFGDTADMSVQYDIDGYPTQLKYTVNVDEYKYVFDYDVDANGSWSEVPNSSAHIKTGNILGTNDIVLTIAYD